MLQKKYKILIVDDEEDNLSLLHRTLRQYYDIVRTTSPEDALNILKQDKIDIILSDHKMPEMDGVEFLKKSNEVCPSCVRLLVTAYSDSQILIDAINYAKIYRYIKKPWEPSELLMIVDSAAEFYQLKQDNDKLVYDLKELFSGTVNSIIETLDAKDSFTLGRSRRVTFLALKMANYLNLSGEELSKLELAGLLHDIGMIGVGEETLNKSGSLSNEEVEAIKKHVMYGVKILEDIKQLKDVVEIIKYHHERFDGSGYPEGISGEAIPLGSRIIAVADSYDGMVSKRSYREELSHETALQQIESQAGHQFDPVVVQSFKAIIDEALPEISQYNEKSVKK